MCRTIHALPGELVAQKRIPIVALFEAFYIYCFVFKHTIGTQLLTVRCYKQEREAFAASRAENKRLAEEAGAVLNGLRPLNATKGEL